VFVTENEPGPQNNATIISDSVPMHGSYDISVELSSLSVNIIDPDGDIFNWSIETSPDIGNSSYIGDVNGSKSCNISGLSYSATYVWFVNCSDGSVWTREVFSFTTETNESEESHTTYIDNNNTEGPWDGTSEHPYRSIQAGIDAANTSGTIYVNNGTYNENIVISKSLNLIGAGAEATIVENSSLDHVFYVTADSANISGFTVKGADYQKIAGIYLIGANHCSISDNNISNNGYGIQLRSSTNNILANNNASLSINHGIYIADSSNNSLVHNYAVSSSEYGIYLSKSFNNTLTSNTILSNSKDGIHLVDSFNNTLADNNISENIKGIYLETSFSNTLTNNKAFLNMEHGIYLEISSNNILTNNNA
ncbi:MAG: right-handed parallel beta-helix repeat-containing protein, partial [Thermoplasmatales archaeon]|nr:right-handed parallel beta-helix repeat-containing protein [Thermoplasmatales archaeon]